MQDPVQESCDSPDGRDARGWSEPPADWYTACGFPLSAVRSVNGVPNEFARLMQRLKAGDETAARELLHQYGEPIQRAIRRHLNCRLRSKFDSQDFAQAVWVSFFANVETVTQIPSPESLVAYLSRMAANKVIDEGRRRLTFTKHNLSGERSLTRSTNGRQRDVPGRTPTPSQVVMADECWAKMTEGQPTVYRQIAELRANGATIEEVAAALKVSERQIHRVIARLQARVKGEP